MSRGLGWVQHACLLAIETFKEDGITVPTTYQIAAAIYDVKPGSYITDAQHVATKRALEGLQRKGRVIGFRAQLARSPTDGRTELCHSWMTKDGLLEWLELVNEQHTENGLVERITAKAKSIGMLPRTSGEEA